jgi:hypothetical protein
MSTVVLISTVIFLLIVRASAPSLTTWYINRIIQQTDGISGTVRGINLALLRGSYTIHQVNIKKTEDGQDLPLFSVERIDISILWDTLLTGKLITKIEIIQPKLSLYDRSKNKEPESKSEKDKKTWLGLTQDIIPFSIDTLTIKNGNFTVDAESKLKRAKLTIQNINIDASNISNIQGINTTVNIAATGDIQNHAEIKIDGSFDPNTSKPTFDANLEIAKLPVSYIDDIVKFYAPFDFEAGEIDMASELKSANGHVTGYIKVGVHNLDVFSWHEDVVEDNDNPIAVLFEMMGGALASFFENDNKDLIEARIPIEGSLNDKDISVIDGILGILKNAFIKAYDLKVENSASDSKDLKNQEDSY